MKVVYNALMSDVGSGLFDNTGKSFSSAMAI